MSSPARSEVKRRDVLTAVAALASGPARAHSPYGQWDTFRKSRLIVFASALDARSQELAQALAARIEAAMPDSRATWARAPSPLELLKLLDSHQADVILLTAMQALRARAGSAPYEALGPLHIAPPSVTFAAGCGLVSACHPCRGLGPPGQNHGLCRAVWFALPCARTDPLSQTLTS
jgi:hypothetical protein